MAAFRRHPATRSVPIPEAVALIEAAEWVQVADWVGEEVGHKFANFYLKNAKREFRKSGMVEKLFTMDKQRHIEISQCFRILFDLKDWAQGKPPGGGKKATSEKGR
jgi:hypothetical protein